MSTCKACGAPIKWVKMESGKAMPVDIDPIKIVRETETGGIVVGGYLAHWATCPKANNFRKRDKKRFSKSKTG